MRSDRIEVIRRALDLARAALELPESEREDWLLARCGPDAALHGEAAALLRADGERPRALEFSSASEDWVEIREDPLPGLEIGRFRIAARLGSGGMGTVYRAEPTSGVARQPVALKLIKRGMDSEEIVARFVRERSILARLEHPHIARLLDGGIAGDGRPWFAMELVDGEPLIAWCDERHLGLDARIALFLDVCDAVAYAHRNLVVHRDLKPANVLVTGDGTVKLLDFGIAKLLAPDVDDTVRTAAVPLMTPEYAAPEQFERGAVTTQTDVYQLGGLLHELLCGLRPPAQAAATTVATGMDTRLRRLAADDADAAAAIAGVRGLGVPALLRGLRGDLARIVRHAMDPVAERRYPGAGALAADLRRFLRGEAVSAADATLAYRLRTFLRRHRLAVGAVAAVVSALAIGLGLALREANELRRAERATENALSLLEDVFLGADPYAAKGGDTRATDLLARARERVAADVAQQPAIAARLLTEIGGVYVSLDDREHAEAALREAVRAGTLAGDAALVPTAAAQARLAHYGLVVDGDKARLAELDEVIARLRALGTPGRAALADALGFKADHFFNVGDYEPVTALSEEALELRRLVGGERSADFAMALGVHASMLRAVGRYAPSLVPAERGYRLVQDLGEAAPAGIALYAMEQYAGSLVAVGRNVQAEPLLREALSRAVSLRGAHSALATGIAWELANAQSEIGRFDAAAEGLRSLLAADSMKGANRAAIRNALGKAELALGNATAAEHEFAEAGAILCPEAMATTPCEILRLNHTDALLALDRFGEADRELAALDRDLGDGAGKARDRWRLLRSHLQMGQGDLAAAAATLAPLLDAARAETVDAIDDAPTFELAADIAQRRGDRAGALTNCREAERRMAAAWIDTAAPLRKMRARISALEADGS